MLLRNVCLSLLVLGCCNLASAQVTLQRKLTPNTKYTAQTQTSTDQTLTIAGMALPTKASNFVISHSSVGAPADNGDLRVTETIETLQSTIDLPGGLKFSFDSGNPDKAQSNPALEPIAEIMRLAVKSKPVAVYSKEGKLLEIEIPKEEQDAIPDAAKDQLSVEARKKQAEQELAAIPTTPLKVGDTWERDQALPLGGGQTLETKVKYTYVGEVDMQGTKVHKIESKVSAVKLVVEADPNAPARVSKSDLKVDSSEGTILFDNEAGMATLRSSKIRITGDITLAVNGMELPGTLDLTIEIKNTIQK